MKYSSIKLLLVEFFILSCGCSLAAADDAKAPPVTKAPTVTQVTAPVLHGEGPFWDADEGVLYFVDINGRKFNRFDPMSENVTSVKTAGDIGFSIPVSGASGRFLAGVGHDLVYLDWEGDDVEGEATSTLIATVDHHPGQEGNRFNDAKADATGRLWAGTMGDESSGSVVPKQGSLYSLSPASTVPLTELRDVDVSNGIIWNAANNVMYYIDSPTRRVDAMEFFLTAGVTSGRHGIFNLDDFELSGVPDGMTIDSEGHLWVALYNGGKVIKIDPVGNWLMQQVDMPVKKPTSLTFGGPDLDILYVTTSRRDLTPEEEAQQPGAGAVFAIEGLGVTGVPNGNNKVVRK